MLCRNIILVDPLSEHEFPAATDDSRDPAADLAVIKTLVLLAHNSPRSVIMGITFCWFGFRKL